MGEGGVILEEADTLDVFGLTGSFPRPGWVVLDAARERQFTGEVRFDTLPVVTVSFNRGEIYLAERTTEPSLGARLVDAGLLSATELERGVLRLGTVEHLGRLFERVPRLDAHAVTLAVEMMTEECIAWLAVQHVAGAEVFPYRRHSSGVLRWQQSTSQPALQPGDPLPAPKATDEPVVATPPAPLNGLHDVDFEELIQWDQPGWLIGSEPAVPVGTDVDDVGGRAAAGHVAPEVGDVHVPDPSAPESFAVIWPSGQVDETPGLGRLAARNGSVGVSFDPPVVTSRDPSLDDVTFPGQADAPLVAAEQALPELEVRIRRGVSRTGPGEVRAVEGDPAGDGIDPSIDGRADAHDAARVAVNLAVRHAVSSVDTGSLESRRRLAATSVEHVSSRGVAGDDGSAPTLNRQPTAGHSVASNLAAETGQRSPWSVRHTDMVVPIRRSVFDEVPAVATVEAGSMVEEMIDRHAESAADTARTSALRRLIGSLRPR